MDGGIDGAVDSGDCPSSEGQGAALSTNMQDMGKELISEDGFVVENGLDAATGMRVVGFGLSTTAQQFRVTWPQGAPIDIPVYVDQPVHLYVVENQPWWIERALVIWDDSGTPLFAFFDGAWQTTSDSVDCGGVAPCPTARQLPTDCPATETTCGTSVFPRVELLAHGGLSSGEVPAVLGPDESNDGFANYRYSVHTTYEAVKMDCDDYPERWLQASISKPACEADKIELTQDNPQQYQLFAVCYADGFDTAALKAIEPSLQCDFGGGAGCDAGQQACMGELQYQPPGMALSNRAWSKLCAMSTFDSVSRIVGNYYE